MASELPVKGVQRGAQGKCHHEVSLGLYSPHPQSGSEAVRCPHLSSGLPPLLGLSLRPSVDGVSPTRFWKPLLHRLLGTYLGAGFLWIVSFLGRSRGHSRWLTRKKSSMAGLFHVTGASLLQPSSRAQRQKALPLRSGSRKMELGIMHPVGQTDMRVPAHPPPHASCCCEGIRRYLGVREASRCQGACGPPKGQ